MKRHADPEALQHPKQALVNLARRSRRQAVRTDMVPTGEREVGVGYSARLIEFAQRHWDPSRAAEASRSLARCIEAVRSVVLKFR
ncbi:MAG TPA: hypothetical protein VM364_20380 [Vicinamibacterales bacterium]|nr:hypothetical protein [Vicinamibacterales bacterium]